MDLNVSSASTPFSGLTAGYRSLLASEVYASTLATMQVDLGGLTNGTDYRLQWWPNDSSLYFSPFGITPARPRKERS